MGAGRISIAFAAAGLAVPGRLRGPRGDRVSRAGGGPECRRFAAGAASGLVASRQPAFGPADRPLPLRERRERKAPAEIGARHPGAPRGGLGGAILRGSGEQRLPQGHGLHGARERSRDPDPGGNRRGREALGSCRRGTRALGDAVDGGLRRAFSRMRDAEQADLFGDGSQSLAVATHDQGVVAVIRPRRRGGPRARSQAGHLRPRDRDRRSRRRRSPGGLRDPERAQQAGRHASSAARSCATSRRRGRAPWSSPISATATPRRSWSTTWTATAATSSTSPSRPSRAAGSRSAATTRRRIPPAGSPSRRSGIRCVAS